MAHMCIDACISANACIGGLLSASQVLYSTVFTANLNQTSLGVNSFIQGHLAAQILATCGYCTLDCSEIRLVLVTVHIFHLKINQFRLHEKTNQSFTTDQAS